MKDSYENLEKIITIMAVLLFAEIASSLPEFPISFDAMADICHIGVNGPKLFDKNGDIPPAYDVLKVHNGKWEQIKRSEIIVRGSH